MIDDGIFLRNHIVKALDFSEKVGVLFFQAFYLIIQLVYFPTQPLIRIFQLIQALTCPDFRPYLFCRFKHFNVNSPRFPCACSGCRLSFWQVIDSDRLLCRFVKAGEGIDGCVGSDTFGCRVLLIQILFRGNVVDRFSWFQRFLRFSAENICRLHSFTCKFGRTQFLVGGHFLLQSAIGGLDILTPEARPIFHYVKANDINNYLQIPGPNKINPNPHLQNLGFAFGFDQRFYQKLVEKCSSKNLSSIRITISKVQLIISYLPAKVMPNQHPQHSLTRMSWIRLIPVCFCLRRQTIVFHLPP